MWRLDGCVLFCQTHLVSKMAKLSSTVKGICVLESFQHGEAGRDRPLFHTWSTKQFGEYSSHSPLLNSVVLQCVFLRVNALYCLYNRLYMNASFVIGCFNMRRAIPWCTIQCVAKARSLVRQKFTCILYYLRPFWSRIDIMQCLWWVT